MEQFELITKITEVQSIASGHGIKILPCKVMSIKDIHKKSLALCIDAGEYQGVSLFAFKIYEYVPEPISEAEGFLRVIDEEDEPSYYDAKAFVKVKSAPNGLLIPIAKSKRAQKKQTLQKRNRQAKRVAAS